MMERLQREAVGAASCQRLTLGGGASTSASSVGVVAAGPAYAHLVYLLFLMIHPIHANDASAESQSVGFPVCCTGKPELGGRAAPFHPISRIP